MTIKSARSGGTGLAGPLGARLFMAASLVAPGRPVADIGCDHGKLAVWLARQGAPRVIAVDSRPVPLSRAQALAARRGVAEQVDCRLGDGLAPLHPGEAEEIVIAGLSGETIIAILAAAPWVRDRGVHLVLLPSTRAPQLRRWLCRGGFALEEERPVADRGRFYTVLSARWRGEGFEPDEFFCEAGLLAGMDDAAAAGVLKSRLADLKKRALGPLTAMERTQLQKLTEELERCLPSAK